MMRLVLAALILVAAAMPAQSPRPIVRYSLTIADGDTSGFDVAMTVRHAPDTFRVAMFKHPEYDDRFFRFVQNLRVQDGSIAREDSALWRVVAPGGSATISYRVQLPAPTQPSRGAWRPFQTSTGALTGGAHAFMYIVGAESAPSHVVLRLPATWRVATALTRTSEPWTFYAASAEELLESPILAGALRTSTFSVEDVPHTIAYWPLPTAPSFDSAAFRVGIERMVAEVVRLFGRTPYRDFTFAFQDAAYGGLEHPASVTLGAPSADLARDPHRVLEETAHEFIHTWNMMYIRPAEYVGVTYRPIQPVPTLWFSEGLTLMYADLLLRRAGLPTRDSTRVSHLEGLITRYHAQPGNSRFAPERVSRVAYNSRPDALGDYDASTHLQGELLGTMLDLIVRDATNGSRSMDDVMRLMLERFGGVRGYTGADIERAVHDVCACSVKSFFDAHVRGAQPIPFDRYLALAGLRVVVTRAPVMRDGQPAPDLRIRAWNAPPDSALSLLLFDPSSVWGRAGLHSGDRVLSVNDETPRTWPEFRQIVGRARIGDRLEFVVQAPGAAAPRHVVVVLTGYERPVVRIEALAELNDRQKRLRDAWLVGTP